MILISNTESVNNIIKHSEIIKNRKAKNVKSINL